MYPNSDETKKLSSEFDVFKQISFKIMNKKQ